MFIIYREIDICMRSNCFQLRNKITDTNESSNDHKRRLQRERQNTFRKRRSMYIVKGVHHDLGQMDDQLCLHCNAMLWMGEKDINSSQASPTFAVCCAGVGETCQTRNIVYSEVFDFYLK
jgi:hypothetical protein